MPNPSLEDEDHTLPLQAPSFSADAWARASPTERIELACREFPGLSKDRIEHMMEMVAEDEKEDDPAGSILRSRLVAHILCQRMQDRFPALDYGREICLVVPPLMQSDKCNPQPKYDMESACAKILTNLTDRREKKKSWQEQNEDVFDPEFDQPFGECWTEIVQTLVGCWRCSAVDPTKTCSRCKLARYCSRECQKNNWREASVGENSIMRPHKEECAMWVQCRDRDRNGGPVPAAVYGIGVMSDCAMLDLGMEQRTIEFLDEVVRCNDVTREILNLNVAVTWNWGKLACLQGVATFRDDTVTVQKCSFVLFQTLGEENDGVLKRMIEEGCGDIPNREKEKAVVYMNNIFREARRREIKIREITCSRAMLWLCSTHYQEKIADPEGDEEFGGLFDPGHGPHAIVPSPTYASYMPSVLQKITDDNHSS